MLEVNSTRGDQGSTASCAVNLYLCTTNRNNIHMHNIYKSRSNRDRYILCNNVMK